MFCEQDLLENHDNKPPKSHMLSFPPLFFCLASNVVAEQLMHVFCHAEGECFSEDCLLAKLCFTSSARSIQAWGT